MIFPSFNSICQLVLHAGKFIHIFEEKPIYHSFLFFYRTTRTTLAESRCPELLAQYCDILLRKGTSTHKKYSFEEIEIKIKDVVGKKI